MISTIVDVVSLILNIPQFQRQIAEALLERCNLSKQIVQFIKQFDSKKKNENNLPSFDTA